MLLQLKKTYYQSSPTSDVKKTWIYTSTPPYIFMAYSLISQAQGQVYLITKNGHFTCNLRSL
jgi:hypothetical protein